MMIYKISSKASQFAKCYNVVKFDCVGWICEHSQRGAALPSQARGRALIHANSQFRLSKVSPLTL